MDGNTRSIGMEKRRIASLAIATCLALITVSVFLIPVQAAPDGIGEYEVLREALSWVGVPYKYGGESRSGVDCSGLIRQVYMRASGGRAYYYDRTAREIAYASCWVWPPRSGDVIIFAPKASGGSWHVGIYLWQSYRNGRWDFCFIHASAYVGKVVVDYLYSSLHYGEGWWLKNYYVWFGRYNPDRWIS